MKLKSKEKKGASYMKSIILGRNSKDKIESSP